MKSESIWRLRASFIEGERRKANGEKPTENEMENIMQKLISEFIGTFYLTFVVVCVICSGNTSGDAVALAAGLTIAVVIQSLHAVSGAHINPCVSIMFVIIGEMKLLKLLFYIMAQISGATVAGLVARVLLSTDRYVSGNGGMILVPEHSSPIQAIVGDGIATFFLIYIALHMVADQPESHLSPIIIGFTVIVNIYTFHGISGCCMNPALSMGPTIAATGAQFYTNENEKSLLHKSWWSNLWYIIGSVLGTITAGLTYRLLTAKNAKYSINWIAVIRQKLDF